MTFIDKLAPYRNKRIKGNTQKLLGSEVLQKMNARDNFRNKVTLVTFRTTRVYPRSPFVFDLC